MQNALPRAGRSFAILVLVGTEGGEVGNKLRIVAAEQGVSVRHGENVHEIRVDTHRAPPRCLGDSSQDPDALDFSCVFLKARLPDRESRARFIEEGRLWFLGQKAVDEVGVRTDGQGVGGNAAWGRALFEVIRRDFARAAKQGLDAYQDHRRQMESVVRGDGASDGQAVPVFVVCSALGGVGTGAALDVCTEVEKEAERQRVAVKVVLCVLDLGTLSAPKVEEGKANRRRFWNALRARLTGGCTDPREWGQGPAVPPVDSFLIFSNGGESSVLSTLDQLEFMAAHTLFHCLWSPIGLRLREDVVDLEESWELDECGVPRAGSAVGLWVTDLDRPRLERCCGAMLGREYAQVGLGAGKADAVARGETAAVELALVESSIDNVASRALTQAYEGEPSLFREAEGAFNDPSTGLCGWAALKAIDASYEAVVGDLIPRVLEPRAQDKAERLVARIQKRLDAEIEALDQQLMGLRGAAGWIEGLLGRVKESDEANGDKILDISQIQEGVAQEVEQCRETFSSLSRMGPFGRLLRCFTVADTVRRYREAGARAIRLEVDRTARAKLHDEVFLPVRRLLEAKLAWMKRLEGALQGAAEELGRRVSRGLSSDRTGARTPVGVQLVNGGFIESFYKRCISRRGQRNERAEQLHASLLGENRSLFGLLERGPIRAADELASLAEGSLSADIRELNVLQTLRERFPEATLRAVLSQAVKESQPRIRVSGEAGRLIPRAKLLGVPADSDGEWVLQEVKKLDQSPGDWEMLELPPGSDSMVLLSYRSQVPLTPRTEQDTASRGYVPAAVRVRGSADPVSALLPQGKPTLGDAKVAATYAVLAGVLSRDPDSGWILKGPEAARESLGETATKALASFRRSFPRIAHAYFSLGRLLCERGEEVTTTLRDMAREEGEGRPVVLGEMMGPATFERALDEVVTLLPFLGSGTAEEPDAL